ncbi:MAG TPA: LacI family DNA-binding transcriptional regulator [Chthonomonadaceae bacterium]|nr:LacI family DNA-binding transcriptional regulator [Chthonomonadaceae bacterium]
MSTIREIARAIGVSPTTVSRAMNGRGRLSLETRQMVLQHIREAGFTPNANAQRLAAGRTHVIALHLGDWPDVLSDMFMVELVRGVQEALVKQGYGLLLSTENAMLQQWANSRAIDGVILSIGRTPEEVFGMTTPGVPCVVIGHERLSGTQGAGSVVIGSRNGVRQVARMLVELGHRRIGYLGNAHTTNPVFLAFREELMSLGQTLPEERVVFVGNTLEDGERGLITLLSRPDPPTALFARTDTLAAGALRAARKLGLQVPRDLSLIGHDDVPFASLAEPPLTSVRINCPELGRSATEMVLGLIQCPAHCPEPAVVHTELVLRESVAAPTVKW